ncbi:hypothetical protein FHR83_006684 [Actinoplanes campanulatus]|uniref:Uncharacterized protein n=1 Tax=Actinoplanes campanulatus TaxID=113559 RepID=A0A7W5FHS9_9ACTN|nr:hypothetical protein [Actinoplanes campanulatus]MBB3098978.1 hypothetical protein [Actinoplanes campanulatus]GGN39595.1 hypothetical protein GCM10010109_67720 [Actinoplanes campanulatus]
MIYRVGNHWNNQTIILTGTQPPDADGRRPDDKLIVYVDSAAPTGTAERICALLNADDEAIRQRDEAALQANLGRLPPDGRPGPPSVEPYDQLLKRRCSWCEAEGEICPVHRDMADTSPDEWTDA